MKMSCKPRTRPANSLFIALLIFILPGTTPIYAKDRDVSVYEAPGVVLLHPVGMEPKRIDNFDPNASITIEIFTLDNGVAIGSPVGPTYSTNQSSSKEKTERKKRSKDSKRNKGSRHSRKNLQINVSHHGKGRYKAKWRTKESRQPDGAILRVELRSAMADPGTSACNLGVNVDNGCLAYFSVMLHHSRKTANWAYTPAGVMPLVNGKTLPIRFQIATGSLDMTRASQLPGSINDPATSAIPMLQSTLRAKDFSAEHPELGSTRVSFNTLSLVFTLDTTVGEANTILASIGARIVGGMPGIAGKIEGVLLLRLPITTHEEMITALSALRSNPNVKFSVQASLLQASSISRPNGEQPPGWTWEVEPGGGNWGMELIRVPQMWGLNNAIRKQGTSTITGIHDGGFNINHPDLSYQTITSSQQISHGTHIAGIIGASFNNGIGVDGVNPFAELAVNSKEVSAAGWGLLEFISARGNLRVVNMSMGYVWIDTNPDTSPAIQKFVAQAGNIFYQLQKIQTATGQNPPFIITAAGNDSGVDAKWSSPMGYAALVLGADNILVVESLDLAEAIPGGALLSGLSNINGHISAPGQNILSTSFESPSIFPNYEVLSGTSMAAPHVAGLASYLLSLDPSLTNPEVRQLLLKNAVAISGGASSRIDAFASAMAIDGIRGNNDILMKLVDIDDGSKDGNRRTRCDMSGANCTDVFNTDFDSDGGRGDGRIDMSDFRTWRDWYLQIENAPSLALDGSANHPKKDPNGDSLAQYGEMENVYPLGDFNGDGIIDLNSTRFVPGSIGVDATDLDVLEFLFSDPHYQTSDLKNLIHSWDLEVDTGPCFSQAGASEVRSMLFVSGSTNPVDERIHTSAEPVHIYTASSDNDYTVKIQAFDASGKVIAGGQKAFIPVLGGDAAYPAECNSIVSEPKVLELTLDIDKMVSRTVNLVSKRLTASYEINNDAPNIVVNNIRGTVQANSTFVLSLTVACPDTGEGTYNYSPGYSWIDESGNSISENVPETLDITLTCVNKMTAACPPPMVSSALRIFNLGPYLSQTSTRATGINDCGQVLGGSGRTYGIDSRMVDEPYLWLPSAAYGLPARTKNRLSDHGVMLTSALALNNSGQILGMALNPATNRHDPALWTWNAGLTWLRPPGYDQAGRAIDINDLGQAIGTATHCDIPSFQNCTTILFLWLPERAYGLPAGINVLDIPFPDANNISIDNKGVIFGRMYGPPRYSYEFFIWQNGVTTLMGDLGGANRAVRNSIGQIAISSPKPGVPPKQCPCDSFLLQPNGDIINLGSIDGTGSHTEVFDINDQGTIVGRGVVNGFRIKTHAFVWKNGVMQDLGTLFGQELSHAAALNEYNQIAGLSSYISTFRAPYRAVVWELAP